MHHFQLNPSRSPLLFYLLSGAGLEVQIKGVHLNFQFSLLGLQTAAEEGLLLLRQQSCIPQTDMLSQRLCASTRAAVRGGLSSHLSPGEAIRCHAK